MVETTVLCLSCCSPWGSAEASDTHAHLIGLVDNGVPQVVARHAGHRVDGARAQRQCLDILSSKPARHILDRFGAVCASEQQGAGSAQCEANDQLAEGSTAVKVEAKRRRGAVARG
eukprot:1464254-Prymnesium_polylepis.1